MLDSAESDWLDPEESFNYSSVDTADVDADTAQVIRLLRIDYEFFIEFFLGEALDLAVPLFHGEIWNIITDQSKERALLAIPRDHAKTTLAKLSVIWHWLFTSHRFCVYLSNTNPIAKGACKDILDFMSHPNFESIFGKINVVKSSDNESLWIFDLTLPGSFKKRCILRAIGQGQQMRGININNQRPDIAVVDDVEDNDNTESEFQQKKLDKWMFGPFLKALARKKRILWLGNMLSKTCLLARLSRNPKWNPVVFGALIKNVVTGILEPLWPDKWTVQALQEDFKEYRDEGLVETWMCEMMNMPGHGENGFTADQIHYQPQGTPDDYLATWITVDPAFGLGAENDESAISVHGIPKDGTCPRTVGIIHGRMDETEMFREVLGQAMYWNAWTWGVEAVAAQKLLIPFFKILLASQGINHLVEILPLVAGKGDPKMSRIRASVSLMAKKEWAIYEGDMDYTTQLLSLDSRKPKQHDDIVDSVAYGPMMMDQFLHLILAMASGADMETQAKARYGMEVEG